MIQLIQLYIIFLTQFIFKNNEISIEEVIVITLWILIMKFFYEKFWVPFFGGILNKFVVFIEGKPQKFDKTTKINFNRK